MFVESEFGDYHSHFGRYIVSVVDKFEWVDCSTVRLLDTVVADILLQADT